MYFFKVTLSSFDDEKKVFYLLPEQPFNTIDEPPVFSEKDLCAHSAFRQYVKKTKTTIVDVSYELYHIRDLSVKNDSGTDKDKQLEQLIANNMATKIEYNDISIIPAKHKASSSGKSSNSSMYVFFFAMIAFVVIFLILGIISSKTNENAENSKTNEIEEISSEITNNSQEG